jgi:uncharacterized delta-60 repeat protein
MLLGILNSQAGGGGLTYWLSDLSGNFEQFSGLTVDSSGNVYQCSGILDGSERKISIAKQDPSGAIQWQKKVGGAQRDVGHSLAKDSTDNIYLFGETSSSGQGSYDFFLARYSPAGAIELQKTLGGSGAENAREVRLDSSNNIFVAGFSSSEGNSSYSIFIAKFNTSGAVQWQRRLAVNNSGFNYGYAIGVDSNDNVYLGGYDDNSERALLAKYSNAGTLQWQRRFGGTQLDDEDDIRGIAFDSNDNIYAVGDTNLNSTIASIQISKWNTSGDLQWQRRIGSASNEQGRGIVVDSEDNVYVTGYTSAEGAGDDDFFLAKYNSSGTIQYQRTLGNNQRNQGFAIAIDAADNLYLGGRDGVVCKLPSDGSLTGTYVLDGSNWVYQAATLTAATSTLGASTSSLVDSAMSLTIGTSSLTSSDTTLTPYIVVL